MSSRFVSSGAIDTKTGDAVPLPAPAGHPSLSSPPGDGRTRNADTSAGGGSADSSKKSEEWAAVQAQLEEERRERKAAAAARDQQQAGADGRSLYEVLQANKAAKQAAFEEANRIKNQFRALDEDEVDFLDEVAARRRREEEEVRRETEEGLRGFREAQRAGGGEVEGVGGEDGEGGVVVEGGFAVSGRKRKRKGEGNGSGGSGLLLKGVKRRASGGGDGERDAADVKDEGKVKAAASSRDVEDLSGPKTKTGLSTAPVPAPVPVAAPPSKAKATAGLGLVDYGSDDDSD